MGKSVLARTLEAVLSQEERAFLSAALHTEGVLSEDKDIEQRIRVKLGLEE